MSIAKTWIGFAAFFSVFALSNAASAQGTPQNARTTSTTAPAAPAAAATQTNQTSEYSETRTDGSAVVKFKEDIVGAGGRGALGDIMKPPASPIRFLLIRPRFNFVSELQKSVENM